MSFCATIQAGSGEDNSSSANYNKHHFGAMTNLI